VTDTPLTGGMAGEARRVESTHTAGPPAPEEALLRTKQRRAGAQPLWVNLREEDASADGALRLMSRSFGQSLPAGGSGDPAAALARPAGTASQRGLVETALARCLGQCSGPKNGSPGMSVGGLGQ